MTCTCNDGVILSAPIALLKKQLASEKRILSYFEQQLALKFPNEELTDQHMLKIMKQTIKIENNMFDQARRSVSVSPAMHKTQ